MLADWLFSLQVTVAVPVPSSVPGSTVHVHETMPAGSAVCFLLKAECVDSFPEWYFTLAWQAAPGEVRAARVAWELAPIEDGRLVITTVRTPESELEEAELDAAEADASAPAAADKPDDPVAAALAPELSGPVAIEEPAAPSEPAEAAPSDVCV